MEEEKKKQKMKQEWIEFYSTWVEHPELVTEDGFIPLAAMTKSARDSLINFHPNLLSERKELDKFEEDVYKIAKKQYETIPVMDIIHEKIGIRRPSKRHKNFNKIKLSIVDVAINCGLKVKNNKAICPFHADTNPSLHFYPNTNTFFCFGCQAKGDIIEFYRRIKEVKNGNE